MTNQPAQHVGEHGAAEFVHRLRVRYGDCDIQGVVFNANYFAYLDDTVDMWFRTVLGPDFLERFEYLVKKVAMEWSSPARPHETVEVRPAVTRWGRTSFDVAARMDVGDRPIGTADLVLVSIAPGTHDPVPIPDEVRRLVDAGGAG